jgi:hypothetical protein
METKLPFTATSHSKKLELTNLVNQAIINHSTDNQIFCAARIKYLGGISATKRESHKIQAYY